MRCPKSCWKSSTSAGESLIQWCNKKTIQEFSRNPVDQPITCLIAPDEWSPIRAALIDTGKVEKTPAGYQRPDL